MVAVKKTLHIAGNILFVALLAVLIVVVGFMVKGKLDGGTPNVNGYMIYTVLSGSMEPEFAPGSIIAVQKVDPAQLEPGDIITFKNAEESDSKIITHRIQDVVTKDGLLSFRTKGDANDIADTGLVKSEEVLGQEVFDIPYAGYLSEFSKSKQGLIILILIPALLIIVGEMRSLWKSASEYDREQKAIEMEMKLLENPK